MENLVQEQNTNQFEMFFLTLLDSATSRSTSYLKLPSSNCFTYCIKEIMHTLKNEIGGKVKSDFSHKLIENFYDIMLNDRIFKQINYLEYSKLVLTLKKYTEGDNSSKIDRYAYFEYLVDRYSRRYQKQLITEILAKWKKGELDEEIDFQIISNFINEMLANGYNYLYLNFILKQYKNNKFDSFRSFIEFIFYSKGDCYDVYLPITNLNEKEFKLFELKNQRIEIINEKTYCKVYDNDISDFIHLIKENILRIESLFNILRFYLNSDIDFLRKEKILVQSKYFEETFEISFNDIMKYTGPTPYYKNLEETIDTLNNLKEEDAATYHKILNTISYAEKDQDMMTSSSYVDNWIALETLVSMSGRKAGFEAVQTYVPLMLVARFILNDATNTLQMAYKNYLGAKMSLERFINMVIKGTFDLGKIKNPFYRYKLSVLARYFVDVKNLKQEYERVEKLIKIDLIRVYMLRNEYVHSSNLQAFNSMQHIKLKHILPASLDEFFKLLNMRKGKDVSQYGKTFDVYSEFLTRKENREIAFKILLEKIRIKNGNIDLSTSLENQSVELDVFVMNVLKNNSGLFKKYCPTDVYERESN